MRDIGHGPFVARVCVTHMSGTCDTLDARVLVSYMMKAQFKHNDNN